MLHVHYIDSPEKQKDIFFGYVVDQFNLILLSNEKYFQFNKTVVQLKQLAEVILYMGTWRNCFLLMWFFLLNNFIRLKCAQKI